MAGVTFTPTQRRTLAAKFDLDPERDDLAQAIVTRAAELQSRVERSYADADLDPTGILRLTPEPAPRTSSPAPTESKVEAVLDAAVGRGAISMDEREPWRRRYAENPELAAEILASLPSNEQLADRAFEEDSRIRSHAGCGQVRPDRCSRSVLPSMTGASMQRLKTAH